MSNYPSTLVPVNHVEPVPRRIRAYLGAQSVIDTQRALYLWEHPAYPQFHIPLGDIRADAIVRTGQIHPSRRGAVEACDLRQGDIERPRAGKLYVDSEIPGIVGTVRFEWGALDSWFEEDEEVFVHPRSPYARVDAIRSTRTVRVELDGVVLAESRSPVMVFETGLPTRYYLNRTDVDFTNLVASATETKCPYKGTTTGYWSVEIGGVINDDLAWTYDFPTRQLLPIAGLIAFYNEKIDIFVDDLLQDRPVTPFS
ncbi:MAG: hypothetical protein JWM76_31 [Pseudonocardiales bacterium]|nr:hypothetical protein [Pseudonocardiales bacterium]